MCIIRLLSDPQRYDTGEKEGGREKGEGGEERKVWPLVTSIITRDLKECFSEVDTKDTIKNNAIISEASFRHCKIMLSLVNHIFTRVHEMTSH